MKAEFNNCLIIHSVTLLLWLHHFFVEFIFIFAKNVRGGIKAPPPAPPSAWSLAAGAFCQSQFKINHKYNLITQDNPDFQYHRKVSRLLLFCKIVNQKLYINSK